LFSLGVIVTKTLGLILLIGGFASTILVLVLLKSADYGSFSQAYDSLPKKDSFSRQEVLDRMVDAFHRPQHSELWILAPAGAMLGGGLLLMAASKRKRGDGTSNT
jgi:hypothetical protein